MTPDAAGTVAGTMGTLAGAAGLMPLVAALSVVVATAGAALLSSPYPRGALALLAPAEPALATQPAPARPARRRRGPTAAVDALGAPVAPLLARALGPQRVLRLDQRLMAAGRPDDLSVEQYLRRVSGVGTLGAVASAALVAQGRTLLALMILVGAVALPEMGLRDAVKRRQRRIEADLPDVLDVLSVIVAAGVTFRTAMLRAASAFGGVIGEELLVTSYALALGVDRRAALEGLSARNPAPALRGFVSAVLQSEELGAPLAHTVADQAERLRAERAREARRRAARAEPRIVAVSALFFLPALMLLLVSILGVRLIHDLGDLFQF